MEQRNKGRAWEYMLWIAFIFRGERNEGLELRIYFNVYLGESGEKL